MSIYSNTKSVHGKPYTPFYYIIGWRKLDRWYVGSRTANNRYAVAHPDELMATYFTSSPKYVAPILEMHGLPDIVWTFPCKTPEAAIANEYRIMCEFSDFLSDERWLNKNIGGLYTRTTEHRQMMSELRKGMTSPNKGRPMSEEQKVRISQTMRGRHHTAKTRQMMSDSAKKRWAIRHSLDR